MGSYSIKRQRYKTVFFPFPFFFVCVFSCNQFCRLTFLLTDQGLEGNRDITLPSSEPPDDTWTISSKSSQSTNEQVSIWVDEIEDQQQKRKSLNEAVSSIGSGKYSPLLSMLNASWDDISNTQQQYYLRKASEAITTALSVIHPGQENEIWNSLHQDSLLVENQSLEDSSKRKYFYKNSTIIKVLVKAHNEVESW